MKPPLMTTKEEEPHSFTMEDWHYTETLKRCQSFLVEEYTIKPEVEKLTRHLHMRGHISHSEKQDINETTLTTDKMRRLIDIIISNCQKHASKPRVLYDALIEEFTHSGFYRIVTKLEDALKIVRTLSKPLEEDVPSMVKRIESNIMNTTGSEMQQCLAKVMVYIESLTTELEDSKATDAPESTEILIHDGPHSKLIAACRHDDIEMIDKILTDYPNYINAVNDKGETALMKSCQNGNVAVVKKLLSYNSIDANIRDNTGKTATTHCIVQGETEALSAMLDSEKVDLSVRDFDHFPYLWHIFGDEIPCQVSILGLMVKHNTNDLNKCKIIEVEYLLFIRKLKQLRETLDWKRINQVVQCLLEKSNVNHTELLKMCLTVGNPDIVQSILKSDIIKVDQDIQDFCYQIVTSMNPDLIEVLLNFGMINLSDLTMVQVEAMAESIIQHNSRDLSALLSKSINNLKLKVNEAVKTMLILQSMPPALFNSVLDQNKFNLNSKDTTGNSVFGLICKYGSCAAVGELLERTDMDFNTQNDSGQSCFMVSLMNPDRMVPQILLDNDNVAINMNHCDSFNTSTLSYACIADNANVVTNLLASSEINVNKKDYNGYTPLMYTCDKGTDVQKYVVGTMLNNPIMEKQKNKFTNRINRIRSEMNKTSDTIWCNAGNIAIKLIDTNMIDLSATDAHGNTILDLACNGASNHIIVSRLLHTKKFDVNAVNVITGRSLLANACVNGNTVIIEELLAANANVNVVDAVGFSPLMWACFHGHTDVVRLLLDNNVNQTQSLTIACMMGHMAIVELLVNNNVDVNTPLLGETPLVTAISAWQPNHTKAKIVQLLLDSNADVNTLAENGSPLFYACSHMNVEIVSLLLNNPNCDVNARSTSTGITPLMVAGSIGRLDIVELLLTKTVDLNMRDHNGNTALLHACESGNEKVINLLVTSGMDVNASNLTGVTVLMKAAEFCGASIVEMFLHSGATVNTTDKRGKSALACACGAAKIDNIKLLLSKGADGDALIHWMCYRGDLDIVSLLIRNNVNVNKADKKGVTPLMMACGPHHTDIVSLLLSENAEVNATTVKGHTPLFYATIGGNITILSQLLSKNADVNHSSLKGVTALMKACHCGVYPVVELLIRSNASVNVISAKRRCTPLMYAAHSSSPENVALLCRCNADVNARDHQEGTALMRACKFGSADVVNEILKADGVEIDAVTHKGNTAFIFACESGNMKAMLLLLDRNANVSVVNSSGQTALSMVNSLGYTQIAEMLNNYNQ